MYKIPFQKRFSAHALEFSNSAVHLLHVLILFRPDEDMKRYYVV